MKNLSGDGIHNMNALKITEPDILKSFKDKFGVYVCFIPVFKDFKEI